MQVSFNPLINNNIGFQSRKKNNEHLFLTKNDIVENKIKKTISELKYLTFGAAIIYFAMKRNFKYNHIKAVQRKAEELAKMKVPEKATNIPNIVNRLV